jgi:NAD(P)-dependent dehydrogenase (short-subunit alcohol dehydrogenase family)
VPDILIIGGSDGTGLAVAKLLAAEGGTHATLVARNEATLGEAIVQLPVARHDFTAADVSQPEGVDLVARRLAARHN